MPETTTLERRRQPEAAGDLVSTTFAGEVDSIPERAEQSQASGLAPGSWYYTVPQAGVRYYSFWPDTSAN